MLVLGIETSGASGAVALVDGDGLRASRPLEQAGRRHAQTLVAEIDQLLQQQQLLPRQLEGIAVSLGPGSFTGLRIGIVCAKTLAYAVGCPLAGVPTFDAIAAGTPAEIDEVDVIEDAQRGDLFVARYRRNHASWSAATPLELVRADEWFAGRTPLPMTGPGLRRHRERVEPQVPVLDEACWTPQAATVARLGRERLLDGRSDSPWTLEPLYIRKSAAEEKWEQTHA